MISRANRAAAQRAPRFPVEFPIRFRSVHESAWRDGWTENVSRSGVLFRCDQALKTGTWVQMCFELPAEVLGRRGAEVECSGHIVRAEPPYGAQAEVLLAATISNYRLVHDRGNAR
ncbi:MAG: PilZ domain-containing protein [Terriglobia bacterium]